MTGSTSDTVSAERADYESAVRRSWFVPDPADDRLTAVCPHLDPEAALEVLRSRPRVAIALPPLLVGESVRVLIVNNPTPESGGHRSISYLSAGEVGSQVLPSQLSFEVEALDYAEKHWPERLISLSRIEHFWITVMDPETRQAVAAISVALSRHYDDMAADFSRPFVELFDEAIVHATLDTVLGSEVALRRSRFFANCSRCGGGLQPNVCSGCGASRKQGRYFAVDEPWDAPLPPKLVALLEEGGVPLIHAAV